MSEPTAEQVAAAAWVGIDSSQDERLEQLHALYQDAKDKRDAAAEHFDQIAGSLKAELRKIAPDEAERVRLDGHAGPPLTLVRSESIRLRSAQLRKEHPEIYVQYAYKSESWSLRVAKDSDE